MSLPGCLVLLFASGLQLDLAFPCCIIPTCTIELRFSPAIFCHLVWVVFGVQLRRFLSLFYYATFILSITISVTYIYKYITTYGMTFPICI
jgi:hypothetical protein